jgi:DNA invertase Pin-like site-specific DNA recombinase
MGRSRGGRVVAYGYGEPVLDGLPEAIEPVDWGTEVAAVYWDWGDRVAFEDLIAQAQQWPTARVLVRRWSDLGETAIAVAQRLDRLAALGIEVVAIASAATAPWERFEEVQRDGRSRSIGRGHAIARLEGRPPPGRAPFGYRRGRGRYVLDRAAAAIVRDFVDHFLLYGSLRGAVRHIRDRHGHTVAVATGRRWLTSPVYRGELVYKTGDRVPNAHPAIISPGDAAQVDRLLRRNQTLGPRAASAPRSLAGLVRCDRCGGPMTISETKTRRVKGQGQDSYLYLRPTACERRDRGERPCPAAPYDQILERAIARICVDLPTAIGPPGAAPNPKAVADHLTDAIAAKEALLAQLPDLEAQGIFDRASARLRSAHLRTEIAQLRAERSRLPPGSLADLAGAIALPRFWHDLSETERRFYFREFIRTIRILYRDQEWQVSAIDFAFQSAPSPPP